MRLLSTTTLELEEFNGKDAPPYAILSHTWEKDEISYNEMVHPTPYTFRKAGFLKISGCVEMAIKRGLEWIWIDTCCIDKSSSAELSESINSMYPWYRNAKECYAYLADVPAGARPSDPAFLHSRWFKRGWTLQEIIAPREMAFFGRDWDMLGTKLELVHNLALITKISVEVFTSGDPSTASVAQRMCWAANRLTTRVEDLAYCLLGLFDVSMPALYGEGDKAFIRLQEEIMRTSDDQSLFAWTDASASSACYRGLLARSPAEFRDCWNVVPERDWGTGRPFSMTNQGLQISVELEERVKVEEQGLFLAKLECYREPVRNPLRIFLKRLSSTGNQFARIDVGSITTSSTTKISYSDEVRKTNVFVRQKLELPPDHIVPTHQIHGFCIRQQSSSKYSYGMWYKRTGWGPPEKTPQQNLIPLRREHGLEGAVILQRRLGMRGKSQPFVILLGYDAPSKSPWWDVFSGPKTSQYERTKKGLPFDFTTTTHRKSIQNGWEVRVELSMRVDSSTDRVVYVLGVDAIRPHISPLRIRPVRHSLGLGLHKRHGHLARAYIESSQPPKSALSTNNSDWVTPDCQIEGTDYMSTTPILIEDSDSENSDNDQVATPGDMSMATVLSTAGLGLDTLLGNTNSKELEWITEF